MSDVDSSAPTFILACKRKKKSTLLQVTLFSLAIKLNEVTARPGGESQGMPMLYLMLLIISRAQGNLLHPFPLLAPSKIVSQTVTD